jgi:hypothetical protein
MRARLGPQHATVATAHKIARVVDHLLKYREPFNHASAVEYEHARRNRELKHLTRRAYTLYIMKRLQDSLRRRDVFVRRSERWGDPHVKLLQGRKERLCSPRCVVP